MEDRRLAAATPARRPGPVRVIVTAALTLVVAALPVFLLGALAPRVIADLGIGEVAIGGLVALFFLVGAVTSVPGGHLTDRVGATTALRLGAVLAATVTVAIAATGTALWVLALLFAFAGIAVPLADTGGARAIAAGVPRGRQGIAFGGKEASIPVASLLAGLTVPLLGAQLGWRPAYAVAAGLGIVVAITIPRGLDQPAPPAPDDVALPPRTRRSPDPALPTSVRRSALLLLALAAAFGSAAANAAPTFLVASTVAGGLPEARAGLVLAVASSAGVAMRLASGVAADRFAGTERRLTAGLMAVGGAGMLVLALGEAAGVTVGGAILALGGGWGWTGLAFLAAVRLLPEQPARAAGMVLAGLATGGALGPLGFGALAAGPGYGTAWTAGAIAMGTAAVLATSAEVVVRRSRHARGPVG